ncbi:MAG: hypothetical protein P4L57_07550 [Rhizomicrobium sp.]|nr:hypothetical protein [Rhizomicrobium sp.]
MSGLPCAGPKIVVGVQEAATREFADEGFWKRLRKANGFAVQLCGAACRMNELYEGEVCFFGTAEVDAKIARADEGSRDFLMGFGNAANG